MLIILREESLLCVQGQPGIQSETFLKKQSPLGTALLRDSLRKFKTKDALQTEVWYQQNHGTKDAHACWASRAMAKCPGLPICLQLTHRPAPAANGIVLTLRLMGPTNTSVPGGR